MRASGHIMMVVFLLIAAVLSPFTAAEDCYSCHSGSSPDGNFRFAKPTLSFSVPSFVQPNASFDAILTVKHVGTYQLRSFQATLDLSKANGMALASGEPAKKTLGDMDSRPQSHGLTWRVDAASASSTCTVKVSVSYNVHYSHGSGGSKDNAYYNAYFSQATEVTATPFELSPSTINAQVGKATSLTVNITAMQEVHNVQLVPGLSIKNFTTISPVKIGSMTPGQTKVVTVTVTPNRAIEQGSISLIWSTDKAGNNQSSINMAVKATAVEVGGGQGGGQGSAQRWAGRILGFVDLILLVLLMPTGGPLKIIRKVMNKAMGGAKRRVDVHCAMSYMLLAFTLLHAALLMMGHYNGATWNGVFLVATGDYLSINIGGIALALMGVISLLGIFQKRLCKAIGRKAWGWVHGMISYTALGLVIVHLLWIGTTASPLRATLL